MIMASSEIRESHRTEACTRVQDAYSLRCAPQVAGAVRDTVDHAERVALIELASAIDNPVITLDGRVESNGNFHGAPLGYVLDFLAIAVADLARGLVERRGARAQLPDRRRERILQAEVAGRIDDARKIEDRSAGAPRAVRRGARYSDRAERRER